MSREWLPVGPEGIDWPRVLLLALVITVVAATGVYAATSTTVFGPYNPAWDGASDLRDQITGEPAVDSEIGRDTARYDTLDPEGTVAIVSAPTESYSEAETDRVREFVAAGGTLVVFENFGTPGNQLLADIGAEARADGRVLKDERHHYRGPTMPVATGVTNHSLTSDVAQLTLNYATAIEPGNATVLVTSSEYGYLVADPDDGVDTAENLTAYPVATVEPVQNGQVIVVGDPSLTINAMLAQPDNAAFIRALYADTDHVLLDLSHAADVPPLSAAVLMIRGSTLLQLLIGLAGISLIAALSSRRLDSVSRRVQRVVSRSTAGSTATGTEGALGLTVEEQVAYLRQRHPEWDEARIRRVIAGLNRSHQQEDDE